MMKRVPKPVFFIVALLILAFAFTAIFGIAYYNGDNKTTALKGVGDIRWGIDISGGVNATFKPADNYDASEEELEAAKATIETRMVTSGITDYELYADSVHNRIIVRFPWKSDEKEYNANEAISEISAEAYLSFRPGNSYTKATVDKNGNKIFLTPKGETAEKVLMDGKSVKDAKAGFQNGTNGVAESVVELTLTDEGKDLFASITSEYKGKVVSIWMDDQMISAPTVNAVITDGKAIISGNFTTATATDLANKIKAGALPFKLETVTYGNISPTLGQNALLAMGWAAAIAFAIIIIIMISFYRLPGFIAVPVSS